MKKHTTLSLLAVTFVLFAISFTSCQKKVLPPVDDPTVSSNDLSSIRAMGFSDRNVIKYNEGYIVEGDIFISKNDLGKKPAAPHSLLIAKTEQYKMWQTVLSLPRTITVFCGMGGVYSTAVDSAIARYNALSLNLTFQRVSGSADITVVGVNSPYAFLGYTPYGPDNNGNPGNTIQLNTVPGQLPSNSPLHFTISVVQHEMGHAIGLRHTDWFNRGFSCNYSNPNNEDYDDHGNYIGDPVGHVQIPGTPSSEDAGSFMLACQPADTLGRNFNANDIVALNYLYGSSVKTIYTIKSSYFSNVYLRMDARNTTAYSTTGSGVVNTQYGYTSYERFYINSEGLGLYSIQSYAFPSAYLRMDANGLSSGAFGGTVDAQFGPPGAYEKYYISKQSDGTYTIESSYFLLRYLRMNGAGVTSFQSPNGGGSVNATYNSPGAYEKFVIYPDLY